MVTSLELMKTAASTTRAKIISVKITRRANHSDNNLHLVILAVITHTGRSIKTSKTNKVRIAYIIKKGHKYHFLYIITKH